MLKTNTLRPKTSNGGTKTDDEQTKITNPSLQRTAMGEYIHDKDGKPLTILALPTPGPADYVPLVEKKGGYTIQIRREPPSSNTPIGPGPTYNVRDCTIIHHSSPAWSLGPRFPDLHAKHLDFSPGPIYDVSDVKATKTEGGKCTFGGNVYIPAPAQTPAPNDYFPRSTSEGNSFTLKGRIEDKIEVTPGPLDYEANVEASKPTAPAYTMGIRAIDANVFKQREHDKLPAPNQYDAKVEALTKKAATLKGRNKEIKEYLTPSPNLYFVPSTMDGPSITIQPKRKSVENGLETPGFLNPKFDAITHSTPKFSMAGRINPPSESSSASSCDTLYNPTNNTLQANDAPKASLRGRRSEKPTITPGPLDYKPKKSATVRQCKAHSFHKAKRMTFVVELQETTKNAPAPGQYDLLAKTKEGPKGFSIASRIPPPNKKDTTPAPNVYELKAEKKKNSGPALKSRASPFILLFPSMRFETLRV